MSAIELQQRLNKSLVSSSQSLGWRGVLVLQYQYPSSATVCEMEIPALSEHCLTLPMGNPAQLTQRRDDRTHESIVQRGDSIFVFQSYRHEPLAQDTVGGIVERAGTLAGLPFPVHAHMLRHGTGYYLANRGTDTRTIQSYLGHNNIQHTVRYTELAYTKFQGLWDD